MQFCTGSQQLCSLLGPSLLSLPSDYSNQNSLKYINGRKHPFPSLQDSDTGFPGYFLFKLTTVVMFAVSSGLFKLCLINAGRACPGETSQINASADIAWKCTLLGGFGGGATSRKTSVSAYVVGQCPSEGRRGGYRSRGEHSWEAASVMEESQHRFAFLVFCQGLSPPCRWFMSRTMFLVRQELFLRGP